MDHLPLIAAKIAQRGLYGLSGASMSLDVAPTGRTQAQDTPERLCKGVYSSSKRFYRYSPPNAPNGPPDGLFSGWCPKLVHQVETRQWLWVIQTLSVKVILGSRPNSYQSMRSDLSWTWVILGS